MGVVPVWPCGGAALVDVKDFVPVGVSSVATWWRHSCGALVLTLQPFASAVMVQPGKRSTAPLTALLQFPTQLFGGERGGQKGCWYIWKETTCVPPEGGLCLQHRWLLLALFLWYAQKVSDALGKPGLGFKSSWSLRRKLEHLDAGTRSYLVVNLGWRDIGRG